MIRVIAGLAMVALVAGCATSGSPTMLPAFEQTLAAQDSATAALTQWCGARHLAQPAVITATPLHDRDALLPEGSRRLLQTDAAGPIAYRHVRLACGAVVLSHAHNWYLPGRLTPAMKAALAASDTPFGQVVAPLHFTRERLAAQRGRAPGCPRGTVLSHRALLRLPDGAPLALVLECYTAANVRNP